jgi:hypothetical protein
VCAIRHPLRPGDCHLLLYTKVRQFTIVPHSSSYVWRYGVQCHRVDAVPANLASGRASLQVLWSSCVRQLESRADGGLEVAHRRSWRRLVVLGSHSAGDGAIVLEVVA